MRPATALFAVVCAGGSAAALLLAVGEARSTDPVTASVSARARSGLVTTARVAVRNTTDRPQCTRVQVVAFDRAGHELGASGVTVVRLAPQAKADVRAALSLTSRQYDEQLSTVRPHLESCR
jgi:hypothetical protein